MKVGDGNKLQCTHTRYTNKQLSFWTRKQISMRKQYHKKQ